MGIVGWIDAYRLIEWARSESSPASFISQAQLPTRNDGDLVHSQRDAGARGTGCFFSRAGLISKRGDFASMHAVCSQAMVVCPKTMTDRAQTMPDSI
jgi:hypothetical protein